MTKEWKPKVSSNTQIIENGEFIVLNQKEFGYQLKLKRDFKQFLSVMDGSRTIEQLQNEYKAYFGRTISLEALEQFIRERLCKSGFIEGNENLKARNSKSFIKAKFIILKTEILEKIHNRYINFIFEAKYFYSLIFCLFVANLIFFVIHKNIYVNTKSWLIILILFICHLFHEVGHAMAAKAKQTSPGNIGFGFFLFYLCSLLTYQILGILARKTELSLTYQVFYLIILLVSLLEFSFLLQVIIYFSSFRLFFLRKHFII